MARELLCWWNQPHGPHEVGYHVVRVCPGFPADEKEET